LAYEFLFFCFLSMLKNLFEYFEVNTKFIFDKCFSNQHLFILNVRLSDFKTNNYFCLRYSILNVIEGLINYLRKWNIISIMNRWAVVAIMFINQIFISYPTHIKNTDLISGCIESRSTLCPQKLFVLLVDNVQQTV